MNNPELNKGQEYQYRWSICHGRAFRKVDMKISKGSDFWVLFFGLLFGSLSTSLSLLITISLESYQIKLEEVCGEFRTVWGFPKIEVYVGYSMSLI